MNTETELKLNLQNEENFNKLLTYFNFDKKPCEQINYFFDTDFLDLRLNRIALRIRSENNNYILTVKGAKQNHTELAIRPEIEAPITQKQFDLIMSKKISILDLSLPPIDWLLQKIEKKITRLKYILDFKNFRHEIPIKVNDIEFTIELDKTYFGRNIYSFELELELKNIDHFALIRDYLNTIFSELNIPWLISEKSKFATALSNASF